MGSGDRKAGEARILYSPKLSQRGALLAMSRKPRPANPFDMLVRRAAGWEAVGPCSMSRGPKTPQVRETGGLRSRPTAPTPAPRTRCAVTTIAAADAGGQGAAHLQPQRAALVPGAHARHAQAQDRGRDGGGGAAEAPAGHRQRGARRGRCGEAGRHRRHPAHAVRAQDTWPAQEPRGGRRARLHSAARRCVGGLEAPGRAGPGQEFGACAEHGGAGCR